MPTPFDEWSNEDLVAQLGAPDERTRQHARHALMIRGADAVPHLVRALAHAESVVRWEAAKALTATADAGAATALGDALGDPDDGVRWLAALALVRLGCDGLEAALRAIVRMPETYGAGTAVHHVLHALRTSECAAIVDPVLAAIESPDRELRAPVAAEQALLSILGEAI